MKAAPRPVWIDSPDEFTCASPPTVPILRPQDPARATRWRHVLAQMGHAFGEPLPATSASISSVSKADMVVCLDQKLSVFAGFLASRLHRDFRQFSGLDALAGVCRHAKPRSLLIVALTHELDPPALETLLADQAARNGSRIGILTGCDIAGLSFAAARLLLGPTPNRGAGIVIDTSRGETLALAQKDTDLSPAFIALIDRGESCEKETAAHPGEVRTPVLALLRREGGSLSALARKDGPSLVQTALEGSPLAVMTTFRTQAIFPEHAVLLEALLRRGIPLGAIAGILNEAAQARGEAAGYVLFGDPLSTAGDARPVPEDSVAGHLGGERVCALSSAGPAGTGICRVLAGDQAATRLFRTHDTTFAVFPAPVDEPTGLETVSHDVLRAEEVLRRLLTRCQWLRALEQELREKGGGSLRAKIEILQQQRLAIEYEANLGLRTAQNIRVAGCMADEVTSIAAGARAQAEVWATAFAEIFTEDLAARDGHTLILAASKPAGRDEGPPCPCCGRATEIHHFTALDCLAPMRKTQECLSCGPLWTEFASSTHPRLSPVTSKTPDDAGAIRLAFTGSSIPDGPIHLIWEVRETARDTPILSETRTDWQGEDEISLPLPAALDGEVVVHALAIHGLDVACARCRLQPDQLHSGKMDHAQAENTPRPLARAL